MCRPAHQGQPGLLCLYGPKYAHSLGVICRPAHQGQPRLHYLYRSMSTYPPASYTGWHTRVSPRPHHLYRSMSTHPPASYAGRHTRVSPRPHHIYRPKYMQTPGVICRPAHQGHALAHAAHMGQSMRIFQASCAGRHTRVSPRLHHLYRSMSTYPPASYAGRHNRVSPGHTTYICLCLYTLLHDMPAGIAGSAQATLLICAYVYKSSFYYNNVYISSWYYIPTSIRQQGTRPRRLYIPIYIYPPILYAGWYTQFSLGHTASRCQCLRILVYAGRYTILGDIQAMPRIYASLRILLVLYTSRYTRLGDVQGTPPVYAKVYASSQRNALAGILHQEISRQCRVYILMSSRPPSVIRQPAYYIRRRLGRAACIYQCLYILALYAGRYTILGDVQGMLPIYANVFISWYCTLAGILYQETSRAYYLYILMSLYPSIIRQPVYYIKGRLGNAVCIC